MEMAAWFLSNFTVNPLVIGIVAAGIALIRQPRPWSNAAIVEALLSYFVLFCIGVPFMQSFIMHVFFSEATADFIGWADSPFQNEVGFANLGFALLGFLAFRGSFDMRLAAILASTPFLWGAALVHLREMVTAGNQAPGNAGAVFYTDILIPLVGLGLVWLQHKRDLSRARPSLRAQSAVPAA